MDNYLIHFNIKGSHWGIRRWQYEDGSLTPEGRVRYSKSKGNRSAIKIAKERKKQQDREEKAIAKKAVQDLKKSRRDEKKPNYSPDYKKPVSEYTNEELKVINERLKLESEYKNKIKDLTHNTISKGQKIVNSLGTLNTALNAISGAYSNVNKIVATTNLLNKNLKTLGTEGAVESKKKADKK